MHAFGRYTLARFLATMEDQFEVEFMDGDDLVLSQKRLPELPTVFVPKSL